jgi:hypothetical protein
MGGKNVRRSPFSNLGVHRGAVKVHKTIDISGQFVNKNGMEGIKATLTAVNYTPGRNFTVCSVTRFLMQGWLNYFGEHVVKTAKGAIFAT